MLRIQFQMLKRLLNKWGLDSLSLLFKELINYKIAIAFVIILGVIISAIQPLCVRLSQQIIDGLKSGPIDNSVKSIPIILIVLFLISGLAKYFHNTIRRFISESILMKLRLAIYEKYLRLPQKNLSKSKTGELLSAMQNDLVQIGIGLDTLSDIIREPITFLGLIGVAFYCNYKLTLVSLIVAPLVVALFSYSGAAVKRYSHRNIRQFSDFISLGSESIIGSTIIKIFRLEKILFDKFVSIHSQYFKTLMKSIRVQELATPLVEFVGAIFIAIVVAYGSIEVGSGRMSPGELVGFIIAMGLAQMPIKKLNNAYLRLKIAEAAVERVYSLLRTPNELQIATIKISDFNDSIQFKNVFLNYDTEPVLKNISFEVKKGEMVAFVGQSGSGKSSIVNLLPRLYDVSGGCIYLDGLDIRKIELASLRALISFVTQDTFLFNESLMDNIRYGNPKASKKEIIKAAEMAYCDEFINRFSNGYDSYIGERGILISGGERQRIAIARAILKNAPILVLDEATSNLDSYSEKLVRDALEKLIIGKTTFLIAHRFSSVFKADKIFVVDRGEICQIGTHKELMSQQGVYKTLFLEQRIEEAEI